MIKLALSSLLLGKTFIIKTMFNEDAIAEDWSSAK